MTRTPIMAGNWKMNLNHIDAVGLVQKLAWTLADEGYDRRKCEAVVVPPFTDIRSVQTLIEGDKLPLKHAAQDVSQHDDGAYTGEISAPMLARLDCSYVVVGHSERREYHAETDEIVNAKAVKALEKGLTPIICVGEGLELRKQGQQVNHTVGQVKGALAGISGDDVASLVIAYEPIWAIGTGKTATSEDANLTIKVIRGAIAGVYGTKVASEVRIQYGGSMNAKNATELMAMPEIDGGLIGGASLKSDDFSKVVHF